MQAVEGHPPTELDSLLLDSINEVIDLDTNRRAAASYSVPWIVFMLLLIVAVMAMLLTGFSAGVIQLRDSLDAAGPANGGAPGGGARSGDAAVLAAARPAG